MKMYKLARKTQKPQTDGKIVYAWVCGEEKNRAYVNSEGMLRVRFCWDNNFSDQKEEENSLKEKESELLESVEEKGDEFFLDKVKESADEQQDGVSKAVDFADEKVKAKEEEIRKNMEKEDAVWNVEKTEQLSSWVPLMQWGAAGANYGNYAFPRPGNLVVVNFIGGDPDLPIIVGSVFTVENPYYEAKMEPVPEEEGGIFEKLYKKGKDELDKRGIDPTDAKSVLTAVIDTLMDCNVPNIDYYRNRSIIEMANTISISDSNKKEEERYNALTFYNIEDFVGGELRASNYFKMTTDIYDLHSALFKSVHDNKYTYTKSILEIITTDRSTLLGGDEIIYQSNLSGHDEIENRLKLEVGRRALDMFGAKFGMISYALVMEEANRWILLFKGDYISILLAGLISFISLGGAFNVNTNFCNMTMLGGWNVSCAGPTSFDVIGLFRLNVIGGILIESIEPITIQSKNRLVLKGNSETIIYGQQVKIIGPIDKNEISIMGKKINFFGDDFGIVCKNFSLQVSVDVGIKSCGVLSLNGAQVAIKGSIVTLG